MSASLKCPDCGCTSLKGLGPLPEAWTFAGRRTSSALPGGVLMHCRRCDLRLRWPRRGDYATLYDNAEVDAWASTALREDQRQVRERLFSDRLPQTVLDYGCYSGGFLASLPSSIRRFGVEINSAAAALARASCDAQVVAELSAFDAGLLFDAIVCMDVIEHVESPLGLLARLRDHLAPGGKLLVTTGDGGNALWRCLGARWWYCSFPEHISFVSETWLRFHAPALDLRAYSTDRFNYAGTRGASVGDWLSMARYVAMPSRHERRRVRQREDEGRERAVPGMGLTRDHLLFDLRG